MATKGQHIVRQTCSFFRNLSSLKGLSFPILTPMSTSLFLQLSQAARSILLPPLFFYPRRHLTVVVPAREKISRASQQARHRSLTQTLRTLCTYAIFSWSKSRTRDVRVAPSGQRVQVAIDKKICDETRYRKWKTARKCCLLIQSFSGFSACPRREKAESRIGRPSRKVQNRSKDKEDGDLGSL